MSRASNQASNNLHSYVTFPSLTSKVVTSLISFSNFCLIKQHVLKEIEQKLTSRIANYKLRTFIQTAD